MPLVRIISCLLVFGWGAEALGGGAGGVIVSALIALGANQLWREQERAQRAQAHRQAVLADEDLRLEVRKRQEQP